MYALDRVVMSIAPYPRRPERGARERTADGEGTTGTAARQGATAWRSDRPPCARSAGALPRLIRLGRTVLVDRDRPLGPLEPSSPLGRLVGPYGLRTLEATIEASSWFDDAIIEVAPFLGAPMTTSRWCLDG